jgi:hypothetical protein
MTIKPRANDLAIGVPIDTMPTIANPFGIGHRHSSFRFMKRMTKRTVRMIPMTTEQQNRKKMA